MKTLPLSEVKMKLSALVDEVNTTDEEIVVTKNGRPVAILVSPDEYDSWKETVAIHSDPAFLEEIKKGLGQLKDSKQTKLYSLEELFTDE